MHRTVLAFAEIMVHKSVLVAGRTSYSGSYCSFIVCTSLIFIGITVCIRSVLVWLLRYTSFLILVMNGILFMCVCFLYASLPIVANQAFNNVCSYTTNSLYVLMASKEVTLPFTEKNVVVELLRYCVSKLLERP